jgi:hypothetical protein
MDKNRQQGHSKEPIRNKVALEKGKGVALNTQWGAILELWESKIGWHINMDF